MGTQGLYLYGLGFWTDGPCGHVGSPTLECGHHDSFIFFVFSFTIHSCSCRSGLITMWDGPFTSIILWKAKDLGAILIEQQ